jgi:ABC-2 type transport system ATP-binding protein
LPDLVAGRATPTDDGGFILQVPNDRVVAVSQRILAAGPVADITIEDVPLEDIIAEIFTAQK